MCVTEGELWQGSAAVCGAGDDGWQQPSFFFLAVVWSVVSLTTEVTEATEVGAAVNGCFAQQRR
ncbi:MAG TPA: hypothetical protein DC058_22220, partial [Planctomycetaceae bacterium]|nr:hypothetical protein [Planctomycetaceae bacterium]